MWSKNICLPCSNTKVWKNPSDRCWHHTVDSHGGVPIPTYLMGPRSFAKKSNSKKVKTSKHHPKVRTLHLERGWDHFPDPSFSESSFKLLGKIGYSTRDFQTIWRLRVSPCLMCVVLGPLPKGQNGASKKVGSLQVTEKRQTRSLAIPGPFPLFLDSCYLLAVPTWYAVCRGHPTAKSQSCEIRRILIIACRETFTHCCKKSALSSSTAQRRHSHHDTT